MVDRDEPAESDFDGPPFEPPGPRRSTYTPPEPWPIDTTDHGEFPQVVTAPDDSSSEPEIPAVDSASSDALEQPKVEELSAEQVTSATTIPITSDPARPVRESLPIDELTATFEHGTSGSGSTLEAMEQLERQLQLRASEAEEFGQWESSMIALGTPEAIAEVENARSEFVDVLGGGHLDPQLTASTAPTAPSAPPFPTAVPEAPEPTHTFRIDEVLESDLSLAPAPVTAPISDIPPPPGHSSLPEAQTQTETQTETASETAPPLAASVPTIDSPPVLHDLVEPSVHSSSPRADPLDFDTVLAGVDRDEVTVTTDDDVAENVRPDIRVFAPLSDLEDTGDEIGDTDRVLAGLVGPFPVTAEGVAILPEAPAVPSAPIASPRMPGEEHVIFDERPSAPPVFTIETAAMEPTPTDQRIGRASRLFWMWFAANSSVVSVAFGGVLFSIGMSLRQAIVATLAGVAISFLPLGLGTLAGKRSGQPTMVVSRATFGVIGNTLPAILALVTRLFWGALLLWFLAAGTARILVGAELGGPFSEVELTMVGLAVGAVIAAIIAFFGYALVARIQLVFSIATGLLVVGMVVITWPAVNITNALTIGDGPWIVVVTGAVLVFSFVGLAWAVSSADLARYQRPGSSGASSMLWSTFGSTLPAFILIAYGALLAASDPDVATGLVETPMDTIALLIPTWYPIPLIAALALSLLSGVVITIYSGGFALQSVGVRLRRSVSVIVIGVALAAVTILFTLAVADFTGLVRDLATSIAVPVAAWAGIFAAEVMIRNKAIDSESLLKRGGLYPDVNWINLGMLIVASAVGFGLMSATVSWLSWQGYIFGAVGIPLTGDLAGSDLGVFVALALGILTPIIVGIPAIRRQEQSGPHRNHN